MIEQVDILLVEDNPNDIELAMMAFRRCDYAETTHVVRDGAEALEFLFCEGRYADRAGKALPRVIFLDLKMPKVSGLEVLEALKNNEEMKYIPVVILTSSNELWDVQKSYALGANSYIVKPIDATKFREAVIVNCRYWLEYVSVPA